MNRHLCTLLGLCLLNGAAATLALAQETEPAEATQPEVRAKVAARPIEEISVVGQRSLSRLRLRITDKEDDIFTFFNEHNSHDRFDILCDMRAPTGTYIQRRVCEPRFLKARRAENARDYRTGTGLNLSRRELVSLTKPQFDQLQAEMMGLIGENDGFAKDLADLADLSDNYLAHRREVFSKNDDDDDDDE